MSKKCNHLWKPSGHEKRVNGLGLQMCSVYTCILCENRKMFNEYGMWEYWIDNKWLKIYNYETGEWLEAPF